MSARWAQARTIEVIKPKVSVRESKEKFKQLLFWYLFFRETAFYVPRRIRPLRPITVVFTEQWSMAAVCGWTRIKADSESALDIELLYKCRLSSLNSTHTQLCHMYRRLHMLSMFHLPNSQRSENQRDSIPLCKFCFTQYKANPIVD